VYDERRLPELADAWIMADQLIIAYPGLGGLIRKKRKEKIKRLREMLT
jgi:hypothetical protein